MDASFITDEYAQSLEDALRFAQRSSIRAVELRSIWGSNCARLTAAQTRHARELAVDAGVTISGLDTFVFKGAWDDVAMRTESLNLAKQALETAQALNARFIRVFAFWRERAPDAQAVADELRAICCLADPFEVNVLVENGTFSTVGEGGALARLLDLIAHRRAAALWDPANVLNGGWSEPIATGARALGPHIRHVHVKNPHAGTPGRLGYGPLKGGMIDWPEHLRLLASLGYYGDLSLETHWRTGRALTGRDALDFPEGERFSAGGSQPTASMLVELRELLVNERITPTIGRTVEQGQCV